MSALYDSYFRAMLSGEFNITAVSVKALLVDLDDHGRQITAASNTAPIQITTSTNHGLSTGDRVSIIGVVGNTAANGAFRVTVIDGSNFTLNSSSGNGAYSSGGMVVDLSNNQDLADIAAAARVATTSLANVSVAGSGPVAFDADNLTFTSVSGDTSEAILLYRDTGLESTSTLIACLDSNTVTGIPVTPGGGNIDVTFHANGIVRFN